jgi:hypothetical protein
MHSKLADIAQCFRVDGSGPRSDHHVRGSLPAKFDHVPAESLQSGRPALQQMPVDSHEPSRCGEGLVAVTSEGFNSPLSCCAQQARANVTGREFADQQELQSLVPCAIALSVIVASNAAIIPLAAALTEYCSTR